MQYFGNHSPEDPVKPRNRSGSKLANRPGKLLPEAAGYPRCWDTPTRFCILFAKKTKKKKFTYPANPTGQHKIGKI
jgi:hypothetical protein